MAHSRKTSEAISYPNGIGGREVCNKNAAGKREYKGAAHWLCNGAKGSRRKVEYLIQPHTDLGHSLEHMLEVE